MFVIFSFTHPVIHPYICPYNYLSNNTHPLIHSAIHAFRHAFNLHLIRSQTYQSINEPSCLSPQSSIHSSSLPSVYSTFSPAGWPPIHLVGFSIHPLVRECMGVEIDRWKVVLDSSISNPLTNANFQPPTRTGGRTKVAAS